MMLLPLYELALCEGLLDEPDYERHRVDLRVRIGKDGRFVRLDPMSEGRDVFLTKVPRLPKRPSRSLRPGFLFDVSGYALGVGKDADRRLAALRDLAFQVGEVTQDAGARALSFFLGQTRDVRAALAARSEWSGAEWVGFAVDGDGDDFVHARPTLRAYWVAQRAVSSGETDKLRRCLASGELATPARLHGSVRMPGTKGAALVSFNEASACLPGLTQGANAPVSRAAAEGYVTALNWLLERTPTGRHRQAVYLGGGDVLVYWTREPHAVVDRLSGLFETDPVADAANAPWKGAKPSVIDGTAFYAAVLGANRARVFVRSWIEAMAGDVMANVARYLDDLSIDGDNHQSPSVGALLRAVDEPAGRLSPAVPGATIRAILQGLLLPRELLVAALRRLLLPLDRNDRWAFRTRCALVKAVLARAPNGGTQLSVSLDEQNTAVPYLLGRLFAVIERLQSQAHGGAVEATLRDRYFRSAATTPAMVVPRSLTLSSHHASKLAGRGRGKFREARKSEIMTCFPRSRCRRQ